MDYLDIVLKGCFGKANRDNLTNYFIEEYRHAKKVEFTDASLFFNNCLEIVKEWENECKDLIFKRKNELYSLRDAAEEGTLTYDDLNGKTVEQARLETIEYCDSELKKGISASIPLLFLTGRINYNIPYDEVLVIKKAIEKAHQKVSVTEFISEIKDFAASMKAINAKETQELPEQGSNETSSVRYTAKQHALAYILDCHSSGKPLLTGRKNELQKIGNERIGKGKGNRFYKAFNEIMNRKHGIDFNSEKGLAEIGGDDWRKIVLELSENPELLEEYLQKKQL